MRSARRAGRRLQGGDRMNERRCIICGEHGTVALGIRARYSNTNAVWAPNLDAYLCDDCSKSGVEISVEIEKSDDGRVTTRTYGPRGHARTALVIGTGTKVTPGQEAML